jgi:hypothetical protein
MVNHWDDSVQYHGAARFIDDSCRPSAPVAICRRRRNRTVIMNDDTSHDQPALALGQRDLHFGPGVEVEAISFDAV